MDKNIGKLLDGRYEITELIGIGGMADVYKAKDIVDKKVVAVKILKNEYADNDDFVRRFRNESKAIAVLSHPNIVKIYDVGFTEKMQFIVMEYIDGITLKEFIEQQGSLKWKDAVYFIIQILRALQHAHDRGIVHRDIKPQNIMLFPDGTIKVMDFGIARFAREEGKTMTDKAIGSVHYISPEQAKGDVTDERSDIYSVGIMLYEMLTGIKPFDGESPVSIALMHMRDNARRPRSINDTIPV
ncbi:MAG: serine/threonine protein kinase, partial [Oscillospiraceae bacterium]|nr:serine/threonine protein kinase [Oscillospiraceae bacterium]